MTDQLYPELLRRRKTAAQAAVKQAVKAGRMVRPSACEKCGAIGDVHGHHQDYGKPLDVWWLCRGCHAAEHRLLPEWIELAQLLRDNGKTYQEIADEVGMSVSGVYKRLNPKRAEGYNRRDNADPERKRRKRKQEREARRLPENRGRCAECSGLMGVGVSHDGVCRECRGRRAGIVNHERARLVELWWNQDESMNTICERLGITKDHLGKIMDTYREAGYVLPYRRKGKRLGTRHPHQQAA